MTRAASARVLPLDAATPSGEAGDDSSRAIPRRYCVAQVIPLERGHRTDDRLAALDVRAAIAPDTPGDDRRAQRGGRERGRVGSDAGTGYCEFCHPGAIGRTWTQELMLTAVLDSLNATGTFGPPINGHEPTSAAWRCCAQAAEQPGVAAGEPRCQLFGGLLSVCAVAGWVDRRRA